MASLLNVERVQYVVDTNGKEFEELEPLARLYFCNYCNCIKASNSLQFEIDSHFCPQTLDGIPPGEAAGKKNKSSNSWQCPSCSHTLSTKATNLTIPSPDDPTKPTVKKSYYQACSFCRWTSRSVGIPDKEMVSGAWSEKSNSEKARIQNLREYYKFLSSKEISEGEQKKTQKKKTGYFTLAMQMQQKYGPSRASQARKQASLASSIAAVRLKETLKEVTIAPSKTFDSEEVEKLPDNIYSRPLDLTQISSVDQRLDQSCYQPETVREFWPRKSSMFVKRSLRCKKCDHNIIKPEYNSSSIRFKISVTAIQHIPEVRINKLPPLSPEKKSTIVLSMINPTENIMHVSLFPNEKEPLKPCNARVDLPSSVLVLSKFDETAEYNDLHDESSEIGKDNPDVIAFRSANKIGFFVDVTPDSNLSETEDVWITFSFKFDRTNAVVQILKNVDSDKKPEIMWLTQTVYINLGKMQPT